jgi:hypothetical protein
MRQLKALNYDVNVMSTRTEPLLLSYKKWKHTNVSPESEATVVDHSNVMSIEPYAKATRNAAYYGPC